MKTIHHEHIKIALDRATGSVFEDFVNAFGAALFGEEFIPLGGVHDGGADAFQDSSVFSGKRDGVFYQASVEANHRSKIRRTVLRLREFGRTPKSVTLFSPKEIPNTDREEDILTDELDALIRIRDKKYILNQVNNSPATVQAFESYLSPLLAFLDEIGGAGNISETKGLPAKTLCVFLSQEVERRRGNTQLLEAVTDSLILWALEGTDPHKGIFLTRDQLRDKIESALPAARHFIRGNLDHRLKVLSSKGAGEGREVRAHDGNKKFCLPYETRQIIRTENAEDETLRIRVSEIFSERAGNITDLENEEFSASEIAQVCHKTIEWAFREQGLHLAAFFSDDDFDVPKSITDHAEAAVKQLNFERYGQNFKDVCLGVLRQTFYNSEEEERLYLNKMSRTYSLLFTLKNDPKIVEYFRSMSSRFVLYVGSDLIIRALSEYYLPDKDRMTFNMFQILKSAGAELLLSDMVLEEVITHIHASDLEFGNMYSEIEPYLTRELVRNIDRILIRAYFYARFDLDRKTKPRGWKSYVNNFCTPANLRKTEGREELKDYLCEEFGMTFERRSDSEKTVDSEKLEKLTDAIAGYKRGEKARQRAYNDALQILRIYSKRDELGERQRSNPYGYRCWWLTQETSVLKVTHELMRHEGSKFIMRPEFILNFISLSPSAKEVRDSYETVFPSMLGVKLSNRLREDVFLQIVEKVKEAHSLSEARARAKVAYYSNRLKGDQIKRYESKYKAMIDHEGPS